MFLRRPLSNSIYCMLIIGALIISGCGIIPTIVPTRTPTFTPQSCPPIAIDTPNILGFRKTVIVSLIQPDPYYEYSSIALELINGVIPKLMEPRDAFYLLRMGIFIPYFEDALLSNGEALDVDYLAIPATPTYVPTVTPTATPIRTPQSAVGQQGATAEAEQTVAALHATATQNQFMHNCAMQEWKNHYEEQSVTWEATKSAIRDDFAEELQSDVDLYLQKEGGVATALPNMAYESFVHVSLIFNNYDCGADDRCFLIVFSDLKDPRPSTPDNVKENVDLTGVKVVSVMFNCDPIFEPSCKLIQDRWTENFASYNITLPPIYVNGDEVENVLFDLLTRR